MAGAPPFALKGIDHVVLLVDDRAAARLLSGGGRLHRRECASLIWHAAAAIIEEGVNNGARGESLDVQDPYGNTIELTGPREAT